LTLIENAGHSPAFIYEAEGFVLKRFKRFCFLGTKRTLGAIRVGDRIRRGVYSNSVLILDQLVFLVGRCTEVCLLCAGLGAEADDSWGVALSGLALTAWLALTPTDRAATHNAATINLLVFMAA